MLVQNRLLINSTVEIEGTLFDFNEEGIADVQPDELAERVLSTNTNYHIAEVGEVPKLQDSEELVEVVEGEEGLEFQVAGESDLEEVIEKSGVAEVTESMSHEKLDAVAGSLIEEGRLDASEYKKAKTKKEKVAVINATE